MMSQVDIKGIPTRVFEAVENGATPYYDHDPRTPPRKHTNGELLGTTIRNICLKSPFYSLTEHWHAMDDKPFRIVVRVGLKGHEVEYQYRCRCEFCRTYAVRRELRR